MKKAFLCSLLLWIVVLLCGCKSSMSAEDFMHEFISAYPLEGIIYAKGKSAIEDGYIDHELFCKVYRYEGKMPKDFALFLNSSYTHSGECGFFVAYDKGQQREILDGCRERIKLLLGDSLQGLLLVSDNYVFYSTLPNPALVKSLFYSIIR